MTTSARRSTLPSLRWTATEEVRPVSHCRVPPRVRARATAPVRVDRVEHSTAGCDADTAPAGHAGVPDRPVGVGTDSVGGRAGTEIGPDAPIAQLTVAGDR